MKAIFLERDIPCDIEVTEGSRIHGESWYAFVETCRTMLGSESGKQCLRLRWLDRARIRGRGPANTHDSAECIGSMRWWSWLGSGRIAWRES